MTEFGPQWPLWHLETAPENLVERFSEPDGGLALVETEVDVHGVLAAVADKVDELVGRRRSKARVMWEYPPQLYNDPDPDLRYDLAEAVGEEKMPTIEEALAAVEAIRAPVVAAFKDKAPAVGGRLDARLAIHASRQVFYPPDHTDADIVSFWLGATAPGLQVHDPEKKQWLAVDDMPTGYALLWRGDYASQAADKQVLPPILHCAEYRSRERRIAMLVE